jgi:cyclin-dependent kinase-like
VAIKKFKEADTNEVIRKTSIREVKILRMINHPNIVRLSEAFRRKEKLCLVFEFVDFSLLELIEKNPGGLNVSA